MSSAGSDAVSFPCKNCGAKLSFDPAAQGMACQYCGHKEAVAGAPGPMQPWGGGAAIRDIPIEEGMRLAQRGLGVQVATIQCKDCGATVNVGQGERTAACAFCGSKHVLSLQTNESAIRPESLLPFRVSKEDASKRFAAWLAGLWFRPSNLKKMASVEELGGVYVPFWLFNADVYSQWTADRGWYYYETETYTAFENGQSVTRTRQVQRTRWESASGWRRDRHENVQICAGKGLPTNLVEQCSRFDATALVPYRPEYLSGWRAESYVVELMPAWGNATDKIGRDQESRCGRDVGGDTHRNLSATHQFSAITFKHVLLPIWIAAYRYGQKAYRFLVNGQTGEVVGEAPWSFWKITALVLAIAAVIGVGVFFYLRSQPPETQPTPSVPTHVAPVPAPAPTLTATATATTLSPASSSLAPHAGAPATAAPGFHPAPAHPTSTSTGFKPIGPGHAPSH